MSAYIATPDPDAALDSRLAQLARACAECVSEQGLHAVFGHYVQCLLPHQGVLLLVGHRWQQQLTLTHGLTVGYPEDAVRNAMAAKNLSERRALQEWLSNGRPLVVDLPADSANVSLLEAEEIERFGLGRIVAHGMLDPARQVGSYMTYCGVVPTWPKGRLIEILKLITPPLHLALMQVLSAQNSIDCTPATNIPVLSSTEQELIGLLARGLTNADIARLRNRSAHTVRNQMSALFSKLGVCNRTEALARAKGLKT